MKTQTKRGSLYDPKERERLLMRYAGIFKNNISEYANKFIKRQKKLTNYSK